MKGELNLTSTHKTKFTKEEIVRILKEVLEKEKNSKVYSFSHFVEKSQKQSSAILTS